MPKYLLYPNPDRKPVIKYERKIENVVNGKLVDDYEEDRTMSRAPFTKYTWSVAPSKRLGGHLNTGLLDYTANIYKDDANYKTPEWEKILQGKDQITIQTLLEYKHGHKPGYYSNIIDVRLFDTNASDVKENFFQTKGAQLNLNDGVTVLDTDNNPIHEVLYYGVKASDIIANSYRELTSDTSYYIAEEREEEVRKTEKSRRKNGAVAKLEELYTKADRTVIDICKALNVPRSKKISLTVEQAYAELDKFINGANEQQLNEFDSVYNMWKNPQSKRRFKSYSLLSDGLDTNVIWIKGNSYFWQPPMDQDNKTPIAKEFSRQSEVIEFLSEPKYQEEQELIKKQIDAKLRV
jgi:hypothetical protein